jgi:hypothetical protein
LSLVAALVVYAEEGNNYINGKVTVNRTSCHSHDAAACASEGACNIVVTTPWGCDGQNNANCTSFNEIGNAAGTCGWVQMTDTQFGCNCN